jgi:hypothetical protein
VLHAYACTYICARNAMLYKRCREMRDEICVLEVDPGVLELPDVVISDHNAAASIAGFAPHPDGLATIDRERAFLAVLDPSRQPRRGRSPSQGDVCRGPCSWGYRPGLN